MIFRNGIGCREACQRGRPPPRETVRPFAGFRRHWRRARSPITLGFMSRDTRADEGLQRTDEPGEAVRAGVTVALAAYLVGLALAIATNSMSGPSALLGTVKARIFSPVLSPAWLDLGYDHRFSYGLDDDADHEIELVSHASDGEPLQFPGPIAGERAARWRRLARTIAVGGFDGDGSTVAAGVGRGGFARLGNADVDLRVFRQSQPERAAPAPVTAEQVYAARVRRVADDVQLIREEPRGEVAPLVRPQSRGAGVESP